MSVVKLGISFPVTRLQNHAGTLPERKMSDIDKAIAISLGLEEFWGYCISKRVSEER